MDMTEHGPESICSYCRNADLTRGVKVGQNAGVGRIGLKYRDGLLLVGTEPLWADVCPACGHIERFYVKNSDHKWIT